MLNLRCDEPGCDHVEDCPDMGPHLIGKPCPKCGASLLTAEDFEAFQPMIAAFRTIQAISDAHVVMENAAGRQPDMMEASVNVHAGELTLKARKVPGNKGEG